MSYTRIITGSCLEELKNMESQSVQCVITSPPYWGLRDYGFEGNVWGGNPECSHVWQEHFTPPNGGKSHPDRPSAVGGNRHMSETDIRGKGKISHYCSCGAWYGQLGLEPTPEEYVANLVAVFREVRRVLKDDGTLWLNLGDSYAGSGKGPEGGVNKGQDFRHLEHKTKPYRSDSIKPKDLIGIPWRVAFALQADGWWLRQDVIWAKKNCMPESVTDRCTKSHEYVFLLTKSAKYHFDHEAIKETVANPGKPRKFRDAKEHSDGTLRNDNGRLYTPKDKRNKRDVWFISTKPFKGAHFAVFPEALVEPPMLAGSREGDTVLDPFMGSGTVLAVAKRLNRNAIGIEANSEYVEIAKKRLGQ